MNNFRRSRRHRFQLEVLFKGSYGARSALTQDVSFHGVFIRTDEVRTPNQLIKFTVVNPENGEHVDLLGIVARCVPPEEATPDRPPGVGVSLFGNSRATEAAWVALVRRVVRWAEQGLGRAPTPAPVLRELESPPTPTPTPLVGGAAAAAPPSPPPSPAPAAPAASPPRRPAGPPPLPPEAMDTVKRAHVRRPAQFNVTLRPEGIAELAHFEMRDISEGGTFVLTEQLLPVGSRVNLRLVHPNSGESFVITGDIVRTIDSIDVREKGIGIRFDRDAVNQTEWEDFVRRNAPVRPAGTPVLPAPEAPPTVRVLRSPLPPVPSDPPVLFGEAEQPATGAEGPDPGGAPILLTDGEEPVPVILGEGVQPPKTRKE